VVGTLVIEDCICSSASDHNRHIDRGCFLASLDAFSRAFNASLTLTTILISGEKIVRAAHPNPSAAITIATIN
jgi:hypothetical protein